jgi:acetyltransferase EpsM
MKRPLKPLLVLGTRTLAVEFADVISEIKEFQLSGFVENMDKTKCGETLENLPVYWIDDIKDFSETHWAVCGLATTKRSFFVRQAENLNMRFARVVHPLARISSKSAIGDGTFINPGVIVASHTEIGKHVIMNRGVLVGHHTRIGDFVTIQPGANVAGACSVGQSTYIGMGAVIIDHLKVGSHSVIAAGAVVIDDVPDNVMAAGVPAKIVKQNIDGL